MKNTVRLSPIERAATSQLKEKGYAVVPMRHCFPTHYKPAHLMALRNSTELLYLKLKQTPRPLTDILATEQFCHADAQLLRRFYPLGSKTMILHIEIWIRNNGCFTCLEVLADGIREVSHV
ncbi:MAG: hypothetical protein Q7J03_04700 [Methanoregula sp.]|nr:hypothetical protein [Methanoregula sp.]